MVDFEEEAKEKNVIKLNERFIFRKILTQNVLCKKKEENEKSCERLCETIQIHSKEKAYQPHKCKTIHSQKKKTLIL